MMQFHLHKNGSGVALLMHQLLDCSSNHTILNYLLCCCLCFHPCGLRTLSRLDLGQMGPKKWEEIIKAND